jgi:hypothetical protein
MRFLATRRLFYRLRRTMTVIRRGLFWNTAGPSKRIPHLELSNNQDIDMDWDEDPVITPNKDGLAAPSQASAEHAPPPPSSTVELMEGNSAI